jgi:hypothetical protein
LKTFIIASSCSLGQNEEFDGFARVPSHRSSLMHLVVSTYFQYTKLEECWE